VYLLTPTSFGAQTVHFWHNLIIDEKRMRKSGEIWNDKNMMENGRKSDFAIYLEEL